ncbi:MAG: AAA-like domain-containing protein [Cyanosarcina radialis HA8281-LM2]|jgi:WD40 repeat protein|nr:AAA-like domain-containing protein [Cyanosarcina radialis HA8281-LM2]
MSTTLTPAYEYQVGGSLPVDALTYVIRRSDRDLFESLQAREFCYVLTSRQMGKSSLRVQTMQRLQAEGVACAAIDLTNIGSQNASWEQWYAGIVRSLISSFQLSHKVNLRTWWRERDLLAPVQRFSEFIEEVLLVEISQNIVIFIDEVDSILSLKFPVDDFFAAIRSFYNQRADKSEYQRLTFALLGVAKPSDLMPDKNRTPFNIGKAIALSGFELDEVQPLVPGLAGKCENPQTVLQEILVWTGGQPFLTQKLCKLIWESSDFIVASAEAKVIEELVRSHLIQNWETQDEPEHLKTIRDRLLIGTRSTSSTPDNTIHLLGLYQQILHAEEVAFSDSSEEKELLLTGLAIKNRGKFRVYNRIYASIFHSNWVENTLSSLRPYARSLAAWMDSNYQDNSQLLQGRDLQEALSWAANKNLSYQDYKFIDASRELEKRQFQKALAIETQAKKILLEAQQKAELALKAEKEANQRLVLTQKQTKRTLRVGFTFLAAISAIAIIVGVRTFLLMQQAETKRKLAEIAMLNASAQSLYLNDDRLEALIASVRAVKRLRYVKASPELQKETIDTLRQVIYGIQEANRLEGHQDTVNAVTFSPDGQLIASASSDRTIGIWQPDGTLLQTLKGHWGAVYSVSFSPDGKTLISAGGDGIINFWDFKQGRIIKSIRAHDEPIQTVSFSPDGTAIASASWEGSVKLWKPDGKLIKTIVPQKQPDAIYTVSFSADSQTIAIADADGDIEIFSLKTSKSRTWQGHNGQINGIVFSPDSQLIASASNDGTIKIWQPDGTLVKTLKGHKSRVNSVSFSFDGQTIISTSHDGAAILWRLSDGFELETLRGHGGPVYGAVFSPNGQMLASASYDKTIKLWRKNYLRQDLKGHRGAVNSVNFSPDGETIVSTSQDGTIKLWNRDGSLLGNLAKHSGWFRSATFSPDGQKIAVALGREIKLWNLGLAGSQECSNLQFAIRNSQFAVNKLSPSSPSSPSPPSPPLPLFSCEQTLNGHTGRIYSLSFSPDGQTLASASYDKTIALWNRDGKLIKTLKGHGERVYSLSFSSDSKTIASGSSDRTVRLWDLQGNSIATLSGHSDRIYAVSFSPDGQTIASGSYDNTIKLWHPSGDLLKTLSGHQSQINSISFSPHSQTLASASDDSTIKLWDRDGKLGQTLIGHTGPVNHIAFSPDGQTLASASWDETIILWNWNLETNDLLERSCDWLQDYLKNNPQVEDSDRSVCNGL